MKFRKYRKQIASFRALMVCKNYQSSSPFAFALVAPAAPKNLRDSDYNKAFEQGTSQWYHIPVYSVSRYTEAQMRAIGFCALGTTVAGMGERSVKFVWPVLAMQCVPRSALSVEQAGTKKDSDELYWLFALGKATPVVNPVSDFPAAFSAKITTIEALTQTTSFSQLPDIAG